MKFAFDCGSNDVRRFENDSFDRLKMDRSDMRTWKIVDNL